MKFRFNRLAVSGVSAIALVAGTVAVQPAVQSQTNTIKIDGSSTVFPITEAVAEDFQRAKRGAVRVTVGVSGTGGGLKKFCRGETDIANASRPILAKEMAACRASGIQYVELPVAYDAIAVVVNPRSPINNLTTAELKKIWQPGAQGTITRWNQVRGGLPNAPIKLYGPGADSGTFDYFTEAIVGTSKSSRKDFTASENDNVLVQGVARDRNALAYFGMAYYEANKSRLKAVAVNNVRPSAATVKNGTYRPLSRPVFIYVNAKSLQRPEVKQFADYYMRQAPRLVPAVKYVALPSRAYTVGLQNIQRRKLGTVFGGDAPVGLRIEQLMRREGIQ